MSGLHLIGLDTDGGLAHKPLLRGACEGVVDLTAQSQRLRLRCGAAPAAQCREKIREARRQWPGPWLTVCGSGDFHHLSLILLETLPPSAAPFTLVLIDNHPDWSRLPPRYHCGNWVAGALGLPGVNGAVLIGQDSNDFRKVDMAMSPLSDLASGRVTLFPWRLADAFAPGRWPAAAGRPGSPVERRALGSLARFTPMADSGVMTAFEQAAHRLEGQKIYVSIDKDCLDPLDAATDWEQGHLRLDDLVRGLLLLGERCHVVGADICGDKAPTALQGRIKRLDAGRRGEWRPPRALEHRMNEEASLAIAAVLAGPAVPIGAAR